MPNFPYTQEYTNLEWSNFHGTIGPVQVPMYCTLDVPSELGQNPPSPFKRHGAAFKAIIQHCVQANPPKPLRVVGSGWSFSNIVEPKEVMVDLRNLNETILVNRAWLASTYDNRYNAGYRPVFVQSGAEISHINYRLGQIGLALQTSGASDGQCIGGCIATGTHGAAIGVGAVHDTVLGLHVIVGENRSLFLHRGDTNRCFQSDVATWLQNVTGIPTVDKPDDNLFHAAQVSLGSLGVVHGVILEAVPIYKLRRAVMVENSMDQELWDALCTLQTAPLHPDADTKPYHVEVIINPYKRNQKRDAFVSLMWKEDPQGETPSPNPRSISPISSDVLSLVGQLSDSIDAPILTSLVRRKLRKVIRQRYPLGRGPALFPGQAFGLSPLPVPEGIGTSTELVVGAADSQRAFAAIREVLNSHSKRGEHLLGVVALRFTKSTEAFLGLNAKDPSCFIDLPSIRNDEVLDLYRHIWAKLDDCQIDFTCHWGKVGGFDRSRINRFFGATRVSQWLQARNELLDNEVKRVVFASPLLQEAGLL